MQDNTVAGFDPVAEAFKVYDPDGSGYADVSVMKSVFENLGFNELSDEDLDILVRVHPCPLLVLLRKFSHCCNHHAPVYTKIETADKDKDGRISLEDFRNLISVSKPAGHSHVAALNHLSDEPEL